MQLIMANIVGTSILAYVGVAILLTALKFVKLLRSEENKYHEENNRTITIEPLAKDQARKLKHLFETSEPIPANKTFGM